MIFILFMSSVTIITGGTVSMCRNDTYTATDYQLGRLLSDPTNCTCLLTSTEQTSTKVLFNLGSLSGCKYKLVVYLNGSIAYISCNSTTPVFHTITSETIKLNIEPDQEGGSGTTFSLNITSTPETNLTLSCFLPRIETFSTQRHTTITSSTESTTISTSTTPTTIITSTTPRTISTSTTPRTISTSTPIVTSQQQTISLTTSSDEETVASDTSLPSTTSPPLITVQSEGKSSCDDRTAGIAIGCFIGGIVFGIIVVLGLQWFRMKRQKKDEMYSTPTNINRDVHTYDSIIPGTGVGNINTTGEVTQTSDAIIEATVTTNSTGENSTNNPSVTYQNVSNNPY